MLVHFRRLTKNVAIVTHVYSHPNTMIHRATGVVIQNDESFLLLCCGSMKANFLLICTVVEFL